ncbi:bola-domain-containing protein [Meredithblackwellia eburnea MCA 4105]
MLPIRARLAPLIRLSKPFSSSIMSKQGPMETAIRNKLSDAFKPVELNITNDSSKHAGHAAMRAQEGGNGETHFTVEVVSEAFEGKRVIARHRLVNDLLKDEFAAGLHALSIKAKTPAEV